MENTKETGDSDLWYMSRVESDWPESISMDSSINTECSEVITSIAPIVNDIIFTSIGDPEKPPRGEV